MKLRKSSVLAALMGLTLLGADLALARGGGGGGGMGGMMSGQYNQFQEQVRVESQQQLQTQIQARQRLRDPSTHVGTSGAQLQPKDQDRLQQRDRIHQTQ